MTSQEKKIIFSAIGIMVVILLVVLGVKMFGKSNNSDNVVNNNPLTQNKQNEQNHVTELSDGTQLNNSEQLNSKKMYKTIEISSIQFTRKNGISVLLADLKNTGKDKFEKEKVEITILGENNEVITTVTALIPEIEAGQTKQLNATTNANIVNAKDLKIGK